MPCYLASICYKIVFIPSATWYGHVSRYWPIKRLMLQLSIRPLQLILIHLVKYITLHYNNIIYWFCPSRFNLQKQISLNGVILKLHINISCETQEILTSLNLSESQNSTRTSPLNVTAHCHSTNSSCLLFSTGLSCFYIRKNNNKACDMFTSKHTIHIRSS